MKTTSVHIGIKRNRLRVVGVGYGLLAVSLFLGCYFVAQQLDGGWSLTVKITGGVIAILLAVTGASAISLLNKKDAGLAIDEKGITDHSTQISAGFIAWKAIQSIESDSAEKMILVLVKNPEAFIKNAKNRAVKQLYERNLQIYKTPVIIELTYLDTTFDILKAHLLEYQQRYGNRR